MGDGRTVGRRGREGREGAKAVARASDPPFHTIWTEQKAHNLKRFELGGERRHGRAAKARRG